MLNPVLWFIALLVGAGLMSEGLIEGNELSAGIGGIVVGASLGALLILGRIRP